MASVKERFESKYIKDPSGCWLWQAGIVGDRYGYMWVKDRMKLTHRVSWELANTTIPKGMCVLHICDVPLCVNPKHLFLGTQKDNIRDMIKKGRNVDWNSNKTKCKHGHPFDGENTYHYLRNGKQCRSCKTCVRLNMRRYRAKRKDNG